MALIDENRGGFIVPRTEGLLDVSKGLKRICDPWPCDETTCRRQALYGPPCAACRRHEQALFTRAERRYIEDGTESEGVAASALVKLSVPDATNKLKKRTDATESEEAA